MHGRRSVFISYSHADQECVIPMASYLARLGLRVWMDTKEMAAGQAVVEQVCQAIAERDLYVVAISPSALSSAWVNHELNTALTFEITHGRPKVLPIVVAESELPASIVSRLYVDAAGTLDAAKTALRNAIARCLPDASIAERREPGEELPHLALASVVLQLRSETDAYYGGAFGDSHSREEVEEEAAELLRVLKRRANGILLNFVSAAEMDFSGSEPKFPDGLVGGRIGNAGGPLVGTFARAAIVEVEIVNPDEKKLGQLVSSKLANLGVSRAVYTFVVTPPFPDLPQRALDRLQQNHVILGWSSEDGADVELPGDLKLCVACTDEKVRVGIETRYQFQFKEQVKGFSVREFAAALVRESTGAGRTAASPRRRRRS